jgi:Flp pilus assembly protein TadG
MRCLERLEMTQSRRFLTDERGATAILFGIAIVPVLGFGAAVLDYSRAAAARTQVQGALDSTALMLAREAVKYSNAELQSRGETFFKAQMTNKYGAIMSPITVNRDSKVIRVAVAGKVPTAMAGVLGIKRVDIGTSSSVAWGGRKVELALVLDNTGSMGDTIGSQRKIDALKSASLDLLTTLEKAARNPDDVKVAIVPFDTQVKLNTANKGSAWMKLDGLTNWSDWKGYVGDRDQLGNYDVTDSSPIAGVGASLFPAQARASYNGSDSLAIVQPLTTNFASLRATVNSMTPSGYTNVAIGAAWGHAVLSNGTPMTEGASYSDKGVEKFLVILTDGDNTRNRFGQSPGQIDDRTRLACDSAKSDGLRVYTIRLLAGNAGLLRSCASKSDMYFDVQNAGQLKSAFNSIAAEITAIRLTQ